MRENTVAFIGAGNMAQCIIGGMVRQGYPAANIIAANPSEEKLLTLQKNYGIQITRDNLVAAQKADVIVLAVKPQMMELVCKELAEHAPECKEKLFITLAAGLAVTRYEEWLGDIRLVRAMPNTPALVGLGVTGLYPSRCSVYEQAFTEDLFSGTGQTVWLESEAGINSIIAITGSAPAYFYYFMEAMQNVALELGFDEAHAKAMIEQTALGAATMASTSSHSFEALRAQVTSKGGTTHEAIETFKQQNLESTVKAAMLAAIKRAEEMAKTL